MLEKDILNTKPKDLTGLKFSIKQVQCFVN